MSAGAKVKRSSMRGAAFAKGGKDHMFGQQAAGPDRPGNTGKDPSAAPGKRAGSGGPETQGHTVSKPAVPGRTAPPSGGLARPAKGGQTAP